MLRWMKKVPVAFNVTILIGVLFPLFLLCAFLPIFKFFELIDGPQGTSVLQVFRRPSLTGLIVSAVAYGSARVSMSHPRSSRTVREMLIYSPWRWPIPLPLGPVHLMPQDVVAVVLSTLWAVLLTRSLWPTVAFGLLMAITYLYSIARICLKTDVNRATYGICFLLAGVLAFMATPWLAGLFLVLALGVAHWGSNESLRRFHRWSGQLDDGERIPEQWTRTGGGGRTRDSLGWPHSLLNPQRRGEEVPLRHATAVAILIGCWIWAVLHAAANIDQVIPRTVLDFSAVGPEDMSLFYGFPTVAGIMLAFARLCCYLPGVSPPLSWRGRLWTGRLILPGFDRVFLVPLLLILSGLATTGFGLRFEPSIQWFLPLTGSGLLFLALGAGPTLEEWRLTGQAHLRRPYLSGDKLMVTQ